MGEKVDFEEISLHKTPKTSPGYLLWHVSTTWRTSIESVLRVFGLTHPQFVVLATAGWLTRNGECVTQVAIGRIAGLDPNTNSQIIKGLEQKKLIKRGESSDGRAKSVSLTPEGSKILSKALPAVEKGDSHFFNQLSAKELNFLIQTFQKLVPSEKN